MLNNFIGGGQIFLHKVRMFMQVLGRSISISILIGIIGGIGLSYPKTSNIDSRAAISYQKASLAFGFHKAVSSIKNEANSYANEEKQTVNDQNLNQQQKDKLKKKSKSNKNSGYLDLSPKQKAKAYEVGPKIDAYSSSGLVSKDVPAKLILRNHLFKKAHAHAVEVLYSFLLYTLYSTCFVFVLIFAFWVKFGAKVKETKHLEGMQIKTASEVRDHLKKGKKASAIVINDADGISMPLVGNSETSHILISGMTGSGKTNLINKILPQVRTLNYPAIIIDQTGEMIARYYDEKRGDIIFNPLDARSKSWDFFADCNSGYNHLGINEDLENFAKVLFSSRKNGSNSDPFWENSAETIFTACVEHLVAIENSSIQELKYLLKNASLEELKTKLKGTKASRYLENAFNTASSILSVMTTSCKPLDYICESANKFSVREYFAGVKEGKDAWLFLSTPPSQRELIMPLLSAIVQLSVSNLMKIGIDERRRIFFVTDELPALGKLPSLPMLMTESRKYGACMLAGLQSYNQLLENYGQHMGSTIFGQFATKFIFRCNEPNLAKLMSEMFGSIEILRQQKSTSYGAHEHRDGISYAEQEKKKLLIPNNKFMELANLECYVSFPDPEVKVAKLKLQKTEIPVINPGFVPLEQRAADDSGNESDSARKEQSQDQELAHPQQIQILNAAFKATKIGALVEATQKETEIDLKIEPQEMILQKQKEQNYQLQQNTKPNTIGRKESNNQSSTNSNNTSGSDQQLFKDKKISNKNKHEEVNDAAFKSKNDMNKAQQELEVDEKLLEKSEFEGMFK